MQNHLQDGQQEQRSLVKEMEGGVNLIGAIALIGSAPLLPWTRRPGTWGERVNGILAVVGFLFVPVFGALVWPREPQRALWIFWGLTTLLLVVGRFRGVWLREHGYVVHSLYNGAPILPGPEKWMKGVFQPFLVALAGAGLLAVSRPLGSYLILAAVCQNIVASFQDSMERARLRQMRDAQLEAEYFTNKMQTFR